MTKIDYLNTTKITLKIKAYGKKRNLELIHDLFELLENNGYKFEEVKE